MPPVDVKIQTGDYEVLASGVVHILENEECVITLDDDLKFIFVFRSDSKKKTRMETENVEAKVGKMTLWNIGGMFDTGNTNPMKMGTIDNDSDLYFSYRTRRVGKSSFRTFEYTFYKK